jgi:Bacterial regulatory proteins, luxR family
MCPFLGTGSHQTDTRQRTDVTGRPASVAQSEFQAAGVMRRHRRAHHRNADRGDPDHPEEWANAAYPPAGVNHQIADRLFIFTATVKTHLIHIFRKLGVTSRAQLAAAATRRVMF